jgi:hypothetical protein
VVLLYKYKKPVKNDYGEFKCPYCDKAYFEKRKLDGHIGGAHRRNITKERGGKLCKFCDAPLVRGKNWPTWAADQNNLICKKCKRAKNRDSYRKRMIIKRGLKENG